MIKNVTLKKMIKNTVFPFFTCINKIIPKDDRIILLYSGNFGLQHNLIPLRNYLVENNYHKKYKIFCGVESLRYAELDGLNYINHLKSIFIFLKAKHVFYTAGQIPIKPSHNQIVIHMNHGTCDYKTMGSLTRIQNGDEFYFTYIVTTGDYYRPIVAKEYKCKEENIFVSSEPTTDVFYKSIKEKYDLGNFSRILLWLPTFRKSEMLGYNDSTEDKLLLIFDCDDYKELNEKLKSYDFRLIIKLHGAQSLENYSYINYSNLTIISNLDFVKKGYDLYQLLMQADVLIGDYSSVSLQYLLLDRPMAYVIPDIVEYAQKRGFVFMEPEKYMPGYKVRTKEEFYIFLEKISEGKDEYATERKKIKNLIHKYDDGKSCERLLKLSGIV